MEAFYPAHFGYWYCVWNILFSLFQVSDVTGSHYFTLWVRCVGKSPLAFVILVFLYKYFFYQALIFPLLLNSSSLSCFVVVISRKDVIVSCCRSKTRMYIYRCSLLIGLRVRKYSFMLLISVLCPFMFCTSTVMDKLYIIVWIVCHIHSQETWVHGSSGETLKGPDFKFFLFH